MAQRTFTVVAKQENVMWSDFRIDQVPDAPGAYVLKDSSTGVLYVGRAGYGRLRQRLKEHKSKGDVPGVRFFDWYQTYNEQDAADLERYLYDLYQPPYNAVRP